MHCSSLKRDGIDVFNNLYLWSNNSGTQELKKESENSYVESFFKINQRFFRFIQQVR